MFNSSLSSKPSCVKPPFIDTTIVFAFVLNLLGAILSPIIFIQDKIQDAGKAVLGGLGAAFNAIKPVLATIGKVLGIVLFPQILV